MAGTRAVGMREVENAGSSARGHTGRAEVHRDLVRLLERLHRCHPAPEQGEGKRARRQRNTSLANHRVPPVRRSPCNATVRAMLLPLLAPDTGTGDGPAVIRRQNEKTKQAAPWRTARPVLSPMGRVGLEPTRFGLKVRCSTS